MKRFAPCILAMSLAVLAAGCGAHTGAPVTGTVSAPVSEIFLGETVEFTVTISRPAGGSGLTVPVLSSNAGVLDVPSTVTIPAHTTSATFVGNGLTVGGPIVVTVRFDSVDATASVAVLTPPAISLAAVATTADQFSTGSFTFTGTATHPRALDAAAITATAPDGSGITLGAPVLTGTTAGFAVEVPYTIAVDAPPGAVLLDVDTNGPGLGAADTVTVDIVRIPRVASVTPSSPGVDTTQFYPVLVTLDLPARAQGETVALMSANLAIADVPPVVVVSAGLLSATFDVEGVVAGGPIGVVAILADSTAMAAVTVHDATITAPNVTAGGSGYPGDVVHLTATGSGSSPVAVKPANATLTAAAGSGLTLSGIALTGNATAWTLDADVTIDAAAPVATSNLAFDANGATPGSMRNIPFTVTPFPTVQMVGPDGSTVTAGSTVTLTVTLDHPARAGGESVSLSSSDSSIVSVPSSVLVTAGMTQATFLATGTGEGPATITASLNGGSDTTSVTSSFTQTGEVIFTEFRTQTTDASATAGEIEIRNLTAAPIAVNGWIVQTTSSGAMSIRAAASPGNASAPLTIAAGGVLIGAPNPANVTAIPGGVDFVYGAPGSATVLANSSNRLRLFASASVLEDEVDFRTALVTSGGIALGPADFPATELHTTQLDPSANTALANDSGANWCTTFHTASTFGTANQPCSGVVINEVLYALTANDGNVFVELAGNGGAAIGGLKVQEISASGSSTHSATITAGRRMPVDGYYVIADGITGMTGVTNVANADQVGQAFDPFKSTGSSVRLTNNAGTTVLDAVEFGAGALSNGEGSPAPLASTNSGHSTSRDSASSDTGDNASDFHDDATPSPGAANSTIAPYAHTITIDATNDFTQPTERFVTSSTSTGYYGYVAWDSTNLYLGMDGPDVMANDPAKWFVAYLGTGGTLTGQIYNTQQPALPFAAKYHVRWKTDGTFASVESWNGSAWAETGIDLTGRIFQSGNHLEISLSRASLGSPGHVPLVMGMLNEQALNEFSYASVPADAYPDAYDPDFAHDFDFDLFGATPPNGTVEN